MSQRQTYPFRIIRGTTAPSFLVTAEPTAVLTAIEASSLARVWDGPNGRTLRFFESSGVDYCVAWGTSDIVAGGSTDSLSILGGTVETFHLEPNATHLSIKSLVAATTALVNVTLGHGQ